MLAEIMLEEERGRELSMNLKELLTENSSESNETTSRMRKVTTTFSRTYNCVLLLKFALFVLKR